MYEYPSLFFVSLRVKAWISSRATGFSPRFDTTQDVISSQQTEKRKKARNGMCKRTIRYRKGESTIKKYTRGRF